MKRTLVVVIGLGIVIGLGYLLLEGNKIIAENEPQTLATSTDAVIKVQEDPFELLVAEMTEEAITASSTEINAAIEKAAEVERTRFHRDIERKIRIKLGGKNDTRIIEIDKETGEY